MNLDEAVTLAQRIPGWMEPSELHWLGEMAAEHEVVVEVGSYRGRSTKVLALMCPGIVYSVDNFRGEADRPPSGEDPCRGTEQDQLFRKNLASELKAGKVKQIRKPSLQAAAGFKGEAGMIFIDGNHRYPAPLKDIQAWRPKLAPDGLLCGHDREDPGVRQCLLEAHINGDGPERLWFA